MDRELNITETEEQTIVIPNEDFIKLLRELDSLYYVVNNELCYENKYIETLTNKYHNSLMCSKCKIKICYCGCI